MQELSTALGEDAKRESTKERDYYINSPSGGIPPKEKDNYNFARAREENPIPVDPESDPVEIAVRAFHGSATNRRLWRWYSSMMQYLEKDVDKADDLFCSWSYTTRRVIEVDGIPDTDHLHARIFHCYLRDMFHARYGTVTCPWKKGGAK